MEAGIANKTSLRGRRKPTSPLCEDVLLNAARKEFLRKGMRDATLREIAKSAGLSATMVYYHFGSKEGLVCELLRRADRRLLHDVETFCRTHKNGPISNEVLRDLAALFMRHLSEPCVLGWLIRDPGIRRYARIMEGLDELRGKVQECLAAFLGRESGAKRSRSGADLKELCRWAMSHAVAWPLPLSSDPPDAAPEALFPVGNAWHERFWRIVSEQEPDQLAEKTS